MTSPAPHPVAKTVVRLDVLRTEAGICSSRPLRLVGTADPDAQLTCDPSCTHNGSGLAELSLKFLFVVCFSLHLQKPLLRCIPKAGELFLALSALRATVTYLRLGSA